MSFQGNRVLGSPTNVSMMGRFRVQCNDVPGGGDINSGAPLSSGGESSLWPEYPATMSDTYHNPAFNYNMHAIRTGSWSAPSTWSLNRAPISGDILRVSDDFEITYSHSGDEIVTLGLGYGGCLEWDATVNTRLTVDSLIILPMGCMEMGTPITPINSGITAQLVIADVPLNSGYDPFQFNHGLIVLGEITTCGQPKSAGARVRLAAEALSGATSLTTAVAVSGWVVGDQIYIPDTRQHRVGTDDNPFLSGNPNYINFDDRIPLASVAGTTVNLASGLRHVHKSARDKNGTITFHPHAVNLSRNAQIYSANQSGSRGHVILTGMDCNADIRYTEFRDLGRTTFAPLNNTAGTYGSISHYGTNQFGRYALHCHHIHYTGNSPWVYKLIGNSLWNDDSTNEINVGRKWAITVHNTHFGLVQDNAMVTFQGSCLMTETGNEKGNLFDYNFMANCRGFLVGNSDDRGWGANTGFEGFGIWQRGTLNNFTNNVVANCTKGIGYFNTALPQPMQPTSWEDSTGTESPPYNPTTASGGLFSENEMYGTYEGLTLWDVGAAGTTPYTLSGAPPFYFSGMKSWHNAHIDFFNYRTTSMIFDGWVARGDPVLLSAGQYNLAMWPSDYENGNVMFKDCNIQNYGIGLFFSPYGFPQRVVNCTLHNYWNVRRETHYNTDTPPRFSGSRCEIIGGTWTLPGFSFGDGGPRNIHTIETYAGRPAMNLIIPDVMLVSGWQGSGLDNFQVFYSGQVQTAYLRQTVGSEPIPDLRGSPVSGLTNAENFSTYGICFANELPPASGLQIRSGIDGYIYPR